MSAPPSTSEASSTTSELPRRSFSMMSVPSTSSSCGNGSPDSGSWNCRYVWVVVSNRHTELLASSVYHRYPPS